MSENLLDNFLSIASNNLNSSSTSRQLKEADIFNTSNLNDQSTSKTGTKDKTSSVHTGDTDSSDDEYNKYYEDRRYNSSGQDIKQLLKSSPSSEVKKQPTASWKSKLNVQKQSTDTELISTSVSCDPVFGLRIVNPLVSFTTLQERMVGREAVTFAKIKTFVNSNISDKNWVIGGVITNKSSVRTSQKGNQFLIWSVSDLKHDIKTVSVFLFGSAYHQLWKTTVGTAVGILNPSVLEKKDSSKDQATLSVDNPQKVLILGKSKDLGTCKSVKQNGEPCSAVVNVSQCEFCIYHIKQEYQKCSKRSELQSNFCGKGLQSLRNKVLGKNEVFYAGKSYTAIPAKRSKKLDERNESILSALNGMAVNKNNKSKNNLRQKTAAQAEANHKQRLRDLTLLEKLGGDRAKSDFNGVHSSEVNLESSKALATSVIAKLKETNLNKTKDDTISKKNDLSVMDVPILSGTNKSVIDLNISVTSKQVNRAKLNAIKYIQRNGPLHKSDPNSVKKLENKKRLLENLDNDGSSSKKPKIVENEFLSDRFKKMMAATSSHSELLDLRDDEEKEKYFHKLEVKEKMEEQMINTYKMPCKAVRCLQCKYTSFSASRFCKDNKHPLKVFDAFKRFFKCGDCSNRTCTLEIVPSAACTNCGSGKWERAGMMKEKVIEGCHKLSIRGGEQKFVNAVTSDANLDLLVPDD